MSWSSLPENVREIAERVLTDKQLEAWKWEIAGDSQRQIAARLMITKGAVMSRLDGVELKLRKAGVVQDRFGQWSMSEEVAA